MSFTVDLGIARIKTTIARDVKEMDECIQALMSNSKNHKRTIGLDRISSRKYSRVASSVDLIQLCDESQCVIFKLSDCYTIPDSLYNFLSLPAYTFVGFAIKDALALLRQDYGFVCKNYLEAGNPETRRPLGSVDDDVVMAMFIPPTQCISVFWDSKDNLTEDIIKLAVSNAYAAFRIGDGVLKYL